MTIFKKRKTGWGPYWITENNKESRNVPTISGKLEGFPVGSDGKESACKAEDPCSISESVRSPGEGISYPLQYSCLENPHGQRSLAGYSPRGHKWVRHDLAHMHATHYKGLRFIK